MKAKKQAATTMDYSSKLLLYVTCYLEVYRHHTHTILLLELAMLCLYLLRLERKSTLVVLLYNEAISTHDTQ